MRPRDLGLHMGEELEIRVYEVKERGRRSPATTRRVPHTTPQL